MVELFHQPPRQKNDPVIPEDRPCYRILDEKGFWGPDDTLHLVNEIIVLWDVPNENMEPMNAMARERFEKYIDSLEESARKVAELNGRYFAGRPRTKEEMIANASADARRVQSLSNPTGTPIMGAKNNSSKRIQRIGDDSISDVGMSKEKQRSKIETISAA